LVLGASAGRLVGRDGELTRLLGLLDDARAGRPAHALISGDAGVGKTRLVAELAARAAERGFLVLSGRCAELGDSIPYLPLADALREGSTGPAAEPVAEALAARPVLSRLLPDRPAGPADGEISGLAQQQLFGAVLGLLAELAADRPVLLILEDLHWADRSTRDLITFLSRVLHRERVAVVGTFRTDDLHRRHPLRPVVAELLRLPSVAAIELGPLGYEDMSDHLTALAPAPLDPAALHRVVSRAEGNPYYAEELMSASARPVPPLAEPLLADLGAADPLPGTLGPPLPSGLAGLLLARVERLSAAAQQVLRAAAVAGRHIDDDMVRESSGLDETSYEAAVREAVANQLLLAGPDGYRFRHALIREALYGDLLPSERSRLHARIAELLADPARQAVPGAAAELAYHCLASHDIAGAFAASVRAGQEAERLAAPAEAHQHYDGALSLWDRVSEPERLAGQGRGELALRSATCAASSGDVPRAVQQLKRTRGFLSERSDPVLASRVHERLAYYLLEMEEPAEAEDAAATAVGMLPDDPPSREHARALSTHAQTLMYRGDEIAAGHRAEEAAAAARAAGRPGVEADALVTMGLLAERDGSPERAIELFVQAYGQATAHAMMGSELRAAFQVSRARLERGDIAAAAEAAHEGVHRAEAAGLQLAPYGLDLQYMHYLAHFADGYWDHAQQLADGFGMRVTTVAEARLSAMALFLDVARGNPAVAERRAWLEPFWPADAFTAYLSHGLLAEHALWRADYPTVLAEAAATLACCGDIAKGYGPQVIRVAAIGLAARADQARRARAAGDEQAAQAEVDAAEVLVDAAREGAAYPARPKFVLGVEGRGWAARAEAEWARARGDNSPEAWQAVVAEFSPDFVYETARSRWRLAEALAEAGQRADAEREWGLAAVAAAELGAAPLQAALDDLGRRARLSPAAGPGSRPGAGAGAGAGAPDALAGLTNREREVLRVLAAGRSNREIAAALFIAPKTASVHVSNIMAKLGAASRTEAAAIALQAGLRPADS
jgi:DNA-binding CsgD family transcriptional regulator